jgi:hypothetical protein
VTNFYDQNDPPVQHFVTDTLYNAYAQVSDAKPIFQDGQLNLITNYWREADIYLKLTNWAGGDFDGQGSTNIAPYSTNYYVLHHTMAATNMQPATNECTLVSTNVAGMNWYAPVSTNDPGVNVKMGWQVGGSLGLYRFDLTNAPGFRYY